MTKQIAANMRGENPDVPVSLIARYPMLNPLAMVLSNIHVYSAILVLGIIYSQLLLPKGTTLHFWTGRILKYAILSHFFIIAFVLNWLAISMPVEDWELSPPISDWRTQVAFIIPFGCTTSVAAGIAFFRKQNALTVSLMRAISFFSIAWWCTIGVYMAASQALGGLGNFGLDVPAHGKAQAFFAPFGVVLLMLGSVQAVLDWVNFNVLFQIQLRNENSANDSKTGIKWLEQHQWGIFVFCYQAIAIFATFVAYFPYCLYGFPQWTCISSPIFSMPFLAVMILPLVPHFPSRNFIKRICF